MKLKLWNPPKQPIYQGLGVSRRKFLGVAGGTLAGAALLTVTSCDDDDDDDFEDDPNALDLGSGDTGILNYAYALEQLEAAFYAQVVDNFWDDVTDTERALLTDIRDHEIAHREFFRNVLGANAIQALTPDFSDIDFDNRREVLEAARDFEDLGVAAYNGAGKYIVNPDYLVLAGKIVSVEARHAALLGNLVANNNTFVNDGNVDEDDALEISREPREVVSRANRYLTTKISARSISDQG